MSEIARRSDAALGVRSSLLVSIASGTLLNPLNSSMIAVALVTIGKSFSVPIPTVTWLVSGFYLAAAVAQPLMGKLADRLGPRRVFVFGLSLVAVAGALGPFAPSLAFLVAIRVLQAFGTSAAYPAGLALVRRAAGNPERPPAAALGLLSIAANVSAALGPTIGGAIIAVADWQGIFLVNLPLSILSILLALRFFPGEPARPLLAKAARGEAAGTHPRRGGLQGSIRRLRVDLAGILLFAATLTLLLVFLLSLSGPIRWPFLPLAAGAAAAFVLWERRRADPFIDFSMLSTRGGLGRVYLTFAAVNTVFYSLFYGLPLWMEQAHRLAPDLAGALMLPFAGLGVLATPLAARLIRLRGARPANLIGMAAMCAGALLLLLLGDRSSIWAIAAVTLVLGVPNAFNNLGLQAELFQAAPADKIGAASGLFQTFRYVGTFLSVAILGIFLGARADSTRLHHVAFCLCAISLLLFLLTLKKTGPRP